MHCFRTYRVGLLRVVIGLTLFLTAACKEKHGAAPRASSGARKASVTVKPAANGNTLEQNNIVERLKRDNQPGSIKHLYVISTVSGQVLMYSTVSVAGQAVACVLTAGAWVARGRGQGQAVRPSMDPTRVEAVILSAEHVNFGPTLRLAEIITDADGRRCQPWRPSRGLLASVLVTAPSPETEATAQALLASLASRGLLNMTYVTPEKFN